MAAMEQTLHFDRDLVRKYDVTGPRYTSYPPAPQFREDFGEADYRLAALATNEELIPRPLSVYVHIPFCEHVCYYCACNRVVTGNYARARAYLEPLRREIREQGALFDSDRRVEQLHLGGGTPTYLRDAELTELMVMLDQGFVLDRSPGREFAVEIDPRTVDPARVRHLADLGFNRMSLGVQDLDPEVQRAVNRVQSPEAVTAALEAARASGFHSTNMDLMYGLPRQTVASFDRTLDRVIDLMPERLAVYNYAHLPGYFKMQRRIDPQELPDAEAKLAIFERTVERLTEAGYVYIGMDHFALPDDELAVAQREGRLQRNFQGYATRAECDLIGVGATAIGRLGDTYAQNLRDLAAYTAAATERGLAISRGLTLSDDDKLRREVIAEIMCRSRVMFAPIEQRYGIDFRSYFADALQALEPMVADGLVALDDNGLTATARGRLLLRNIAMAFDAYLRNSSSGQARFSRTI